MSNKTVRLNNGMGPEITVPEWDDNGPQASQWVDWFLLQSYEAQQFIAAFSLDAEAAASHLIGAFKKAEQELKDETTPIHITLMQLMVAYYRTSPQILVANDAISAQPSDD